MIKIRLARGGKKNSPFYRVVVIEKTRKRSGIPLDVAGFWDPKNNKLKLDHKKVDAWVEKGAKLSESLKKLMK